ncbi:MAG: protein jag [Patescibacteria group bacterium]
MERIKKIVEELLEVMRIEGVEIDIKKDSSLKDKELLIIDIKLDPREAKSFLNENASGLNAFQHLLRVLAFKNNLSQNFLIVDINNYRKEREKFLTDLALKVAQKVRRTKKPVILEPMSAYERRFIHLRLAEYPDITTESIGEEPERKVVVRLYP